MPARKEMQPMSNNRFLFNTEARHPKSLAIGRSLAQRAKLHFKAQGYDVHLHDHVLEFGENLPDGDTLDRVYRSLSTNRFVLMDIDSENNRLAF